MIIFKKLIKEDMPLFLSWAKKPHVMDTWFIDGYEPIDKYQQKIECNGYDYGFIIYLDDKLSYEKVGFKVIRKENDGVNECCVMELK